MAFEFGRVSSRDELVAVQRLRYDVYVEQMGRYRHSADHSARLLAEPEDESSWIFYACDGPEMVGTARVTWGGDGFSARQVQQYSLAPFLDEIPGGLMAVGERTTVRAEFRGTDLIDRMMEPSEQLQNAHGVRLVFGCCEPHLLNLYIAMGQRPYAERNINSPEAGYLIPLVAFVPDGSPLVGYDCVDRVVADQPRVTNGALIGDAAYRAEVRRDLDEVGRGGHGPFDGLIGDEVARCVARSSVIECALGDVVLRAGGTARNIFVVLDGTLEVRDGDRFVAALTEGEMFGEMAFLLERTRVFDVVAATDDVRVLSLSEGALRRMIAEDPVVAAKLLLNVSKMLCVRLIKADVR